MSTRKQTEIAIFAAAFANTLRDLDGNASYTGAEKATMAHASGTAAVRMYEIACPSPKEFEDLPRPCVAQDADGDRLTVHSDGSWQYQESLSIGTYTAAQVWSADDPPSQGPFKIIEEG